VEIRSERAGLGLNDEKKKDKSDPEATVLPGDTYQMAAKKKARARFYSLMED